MGRRKGELSRATVDLNWPHQVALRADAVRPLYFDIDTFGGQLGMAPRRHAVVFEDEWYLVFCFPDPTSADAFRERFGGEPFNPKERGRGTRWHEWNKSKPQELPRA